MQTTQAENSAPVFGATRQPTARQPATLEATLNAKLRKISGSAGVLGAAYRGPEDYYLVSTEKHALTGYLTDMVRSAVMGFEAHKVIEPGVNPSENMEPVMRVIFARAEQTCILYYYAESAERHHYLLVAVKTGHSICKSVKRMVQRHVGRPLIEAK